MKPAIFSHCPREVLPRVSYSAGSTRLESHFKKATSIHVFVPIFVAMKPAIFSLLLMFVMTTNQAQSLIERFDDGDFTANPTWTGHTNLFAVTNGELQLRDLAPPANGTAYLAVAAPTDLSQATTWEFYVRLAFAPSTTNFARVYLSANSPQLDGALNGYFVRIGGINGDGDAVELFRQNGTTTTLLISGQAGAVGLEPAIARVRITRSTSGEWSMSADYTGGTNFVAQGTPVTDVAHPVGSFAGVYCRYTGTRAQSFFYDDFIIDPLFFDTTPPVLNSAAVESANSVLLSFNEPLEAASGANAVNYLINNGIGQPASAQITANPTQVRLQLASSLVNLQNYQVTATGIRDAAGNTAGAQSANFIFYNIQPAQPGDLIVTEFMPDPSPVISNLPEAEYLELYNRSNKVLQLQDIRYSNGGTPQPLPSFLLLPDKYVIVCSQSNAAAFAAFGDVAGMNSFPALTNSGDEIILSNAQGEELLYLEYDLSWYRNPAKTDGGWSIERIGNNLPDNCPANWRASIHPRGGTPGQANSVQGTPDDNAGPMLLRAAVPTASSIIVTFDEPLSVATLSAAWFSLSDGITVNSATLLSPATQVLLALSAPLMAGRAYTLSVTADARDCLGNRAAAVMTTRIGLAETMAPGDVIINELLFNPRTGGQDFLELYNASDKTLNLRGLQIQNTQRTTSFSTTFQSDFLLFPDEYAAVSSDIANIQAYYNVPNISALVQNALPGFDDKSGNMTLLSNGVVIDAFDYSETWHSPLLDTKDGVSLERIDPAGPSQSAGNWHSAAAAVGFATPGYRNSQFRNSPSLADEMISLPNKTFSPDGDGNEDVLQIFYTAEKAGFLLNLRIFDAHGRQVRTLLRSELLGSEGVFKWDGANDEGTKARTGIYILWIELFHPDGQVERVKKTCVLAGF